MAVHASTSSFILLDYMSSLIMCSAYGEAQGCPRVVQGVVYAKSVVLSSPINKVLDLQKCVDCYGIILESTDVT